MVPGIFCQTMSTILNAPAKEEDDLLARLGLLIGQSFFLGLTLGLLIVAAIALLLSIYGAGALPYVYIVVAIFGAVAFYGFAEVQRRYSLVQVSIVTELIIIAFLAAAWAGLVYAQAEWLAFAAMVAFSLIIQVGFVILGGQAGRLLDVRQIKRYFPRIIAGLVVGFMVAGVLVSPIQNWLGGTEYLLLASAISAVVMLAMLLATNTRYRAVLAQNSSSGPPVKAPSLRKVLFKRFVILIFAYQMLSAIVSQLLDFMAMAAAGERFANSDVLTSFFGNLTIVLNLVNLLFLVLIAGILLTRFGLKFGLSANIGVDILLLLAVVVTGIVAGPEASIFFWLVVITRVTDITFTDGTTRTSINAAFQALPANERVTVQTGVEGIGVPLALGLTGVILLIFDAVGNVTLVHIAAFTLLVTLLWLGSALVVYRRYGVNLLKSMRRRVLDPVELTLDDEASLAVIQRLISSNKLTDVRLALDMLQGAEHPSLAQHLQNLAQSDTAEIQIEALSRIESIKLQAALPIVQGLSANHGDPKVQGAAIKTLCALRGADAVEAVTPYLNDPQSDIRLGTAVGLLHYGSIPGILVVGPRLKEWEVSGDTSDRFCLAQVIGDVALSHLYQPLIPLLNDPDPEVRRSALAAAGRVKHPRLLPQIAANLSDSKTRSAASDALVSYGSLILPLVEEALSRGAENEENTVRLVRACRQIKGQEVTNLMRRNLDHSSNLVRDQVLRVLTACAFHGEPADLPALNRALVRDVSHGHQILVTQQDSGQSKATEPLQRALHDELTQVKKRIFWLLAILYEAQAISRAAAQLQQGTGSEQAIAFEMLDVTLSPEHKTLTFPLIDPKLNPTQRIQFLAKRIKTSSLYRDERLLDLIANDNQAWIRACALYAAVHLAKVAQLEARNIVPIIEDLLVDPDPIVRETAVWGLYTLAPENFYLRAEILQADEDQHIARMAAELAAELAA